MELRGKVVIVTGAGSGIGAALTRRLLAEGAKVVLAGRHEDRLHAVIASSAAPANATALHVDVARLEDLEKLVAHAVEAFGGIDAVVNNAGVLLAGPLTELTPAETESLVRVNLLGPIWLTQLALPFLLAREQAMVVNVSSLSGLAPVPFQAAYAGSKFGLKGFSTGLRRDLAATHVRVLVVYPGGIDTDMTKEIFRRGHELGVVKGEARSPDLAAAAIYSAMKKGKSELLICSPLERALALFDQIARPVVDLAFKGTAERIGQMLVAANRYGREQLPERTDDG